MIFSENISRNQSIVDSNFNLETVVSAMKSMSESLNKLSKMVEQLPKIKNDSQAKDVSVENLYAEKEESIKKAAGELKTLRGYGKQLEQYVAACRQNGNQISKDAKSLNMGQAKEKYTFAELSLGFNIKKATQRRKELSDMISWAEEVLKLARSKKFPGRVPKKRFIPPPEIMATLAGVKRIQPPIQAPAASFSSGPSINSELNSLMALGPIGGGPVGIDPSMSGV